MSDMNYYFNDITINSKNLIESGVCVPNDCNQSDVNTMFNITKLLPSSNDLKSLQSNYTNWQHNVDRLYDHPKPIQFWLFFIYVG